MALRKLAKRAKLFGLGLAGLVMIGAGRTEKVNAQECAELFAEDNRAKNQAYEHSPGFALDNGNLLRFGAYNDTCNWTDGAPGQKKTGPRVSRAGVYIEVGHGLTNNCTTYIKVGAENPVVVNGISKKDDFNDTYNVSPNHFVPMAGIGVRFKQENANRTLGVYGEAEVCGVSEFSESISYGNDWSEIHVDRATHLRGSLLGKIHPNFFDKVSFLENTRFIGGIDLSSSYISGDIFDHETDEVKYREFYPRNKTCFRPVIGIDYKNISCTTKIGNGGAGIDINFSKRF